MVTNLIHEKTVPLDDAIVIYIHLVHLQNQGMWKNGSAPQWAKDTAEALHASTRSVVLAATAWQVVAETFAKELSIYE